ncbi:MAG TPA: CRISPR-associated endonuclease Cas2 [Ignavibacteria bacterium]|nr:CRISPR-associated endonuclease Cas2 [Ignavibacteria bacterium]
MSFERLNAYRIMWLFVFFDLPTETKMDRKNYTKFRKCLLKDGFTMMQYSVYIRNCASKESTNVHLKRVEKNIPRKGNISIMEVTDKQYGNIKTFWGRETIPQKPSSPQLEFF